MSSNNFVPSNMARYQIFFKNILSYVKSKTVEMEDPMWTIPSEEVFELEVAYDKWYAAYEPSINPKDYGVIPVRNAARAEFEVVLRRFIRRFLYDPLVTDADRAAMHIPINDTTRVPYMPKLNVHERVAAWSEINNIHQVILHIKVKGASNRANSVHYSGAVVLWQVRKLSDPTPKEPTDLKNYRMFSTPKGQLVFTGSERGKVVDFAAAWQNAFGNLGEYSEIQSAVIP